MTATSKAPRQICMMRFLIKGGPSDKTRIRGRKIDLGICMKFFKYGQHVWCALVVFMYCDYPVLAGNR